MPTYPEQVCQVAQRLLQAVQKGFADAGVALPDRQFLYAGVAPPVDFDTAETDAPGMLAVGLGPVSAGGPGSTIAVGVQPQLTRRSAQLRLWLFRPVSHLGDQGQIPAPGDMTADALVVFTDTAVMLGALEDARRDWSIVARQAEYAIGPIQPVTVQGGYAGITATVDVDLIDPDSWAG